MISTSEIHPMTEFIRNYKTHLERMKETGSPQALTINGVAECIVIAPEQFEEMFAAWEKQRFYNAVREGIESMNSGTGLSLEEAFSQINKRSGL